ncbi:MAG: shikimate kinase [Saezia sp.]
MMISLPLVFIGLLGAGKTSVGKKLASKLDLDFYDSDQVFEDQVQQSIASFFASQGEQKFRELESSILFELIQEGEKIISTGGGAVLSAQNRALLKKKALCIYLDIDLDTLYERLKKDASRPLLHGVDLRQRLEELKTQREAYYQECAHITIFTEGKNIEEVMMEIMERLKHANYIPS